MVTSKSTVLGLRLDHVRRAWVEAEAARQGVTVRVFFEHLIDQAQSSGTSGRPSAVAGSEPAPDPLMADHVPGHTEAPTASPCPDLGAVVTLPLEAIRSAVSITAALAKTGGHCIRWSWRTCAVVKGRLDRSTWSTENNGRTRS